MTELPDHILEDIRENDAQIAFRRFAIGRAIVAGNLERGAQIAKEMSVSYARISEILTMQTNQNKEKKDNGQAS